MNKKLIIAFVIFTALGLAIFYFLTAGRVGLEYDTVLVEKQAIAKFIEETGVVTSREVRPYYGNGQKTVNEVNIELGQSVKKGQVLIRYKNTVDLEIQKIK